MKLDTKRLVNKSIAVAALFCMATQSTFAALLNFATVPLFIGASVPPQVMLTISKDQQLHYKAYTDYVDLDIPGDGVVETTYKHSINYYGYFDPIKCYNYDTGLARFIPIAVSPGNNKKCSTVAGARWSGNFLNWVSMSRLDTIRKLLYGGYRSTDLSNLTVLERSLIPPDAHAWAKYYNGDGSAADQPAISELTPHSPSTTAPTGVATGATTSGYGTSGAQPISAVTSPVTTKFFRRSALSVCKGDQVKVAIDAANYVVGRVSAVNTGDCSVAGSTTATGGFSLDVVPGSGVVGAGAGSAVDDAYTVTNLSRTGISFCNVTPATAGYSHTTANPPLIRAAAGNFALWANNERTQCYWNPGGRGLGTFTAAQRGSNGNYGSLAGGATLPAGLISWASSQEPIQATHGLTSDGTAAGVYDMTARVEVCKVGLLGSEKCKQYNTANVYKPIGLLQDYGDPNLIHFGLMTGSFAKNKSGGVLRKNTSSLNNEIAADGTFLSPAGGSIITTLNRLKMFGYEYPTSLSTSTGTQDSYSALDGCGIIDSSSGTATINRGDAVEGRCANWGSPIAEMYLESVRYFAGRTPSTDYDYTAGATKDDTLGLPKANWTDPLSASNFCAPLNVVVFNPAFVTFDNDALGGVTDLNGAGATTARALTNTVGTLEGINGQSKFVGNDGASVNNNLCTAKNNVQLGDIFGICPEAPRGQGSYLIAGIAHHAHTNRIRSDLTVPASDVKSLKVSTYGVAAGAKAGVRVPVPGTSNFVTLLPAARVEDRYLTVTSGLNDYGSGGLVDFKIVSQDANSGRMLVQWEVSQQGADYDMDVWGVINYVIDTSVSPPTITVTTDAIANAASGTFGFGYIINGTTKDGAHYHSGGGTTGHTFVDPTGVLGCAGCVVGNGPTSVTYTVDTAGTGATLLEDPLYYAAKYGGFIDSNGSNTPDVQREWDSRLANGQPGQDGIPDNFFLVSNPLGLESALDRVFISILAQASASSVATNSTSLQTGTTIYQARFNANDWTGQVLAFPVNADGTIASTPAWDAGQVINGQNHNTGRTVLTYNETSTVRDGVPFRWPSNPASPAANEISLALVNALNISPGTATSDARGQERLDWLRGDPSLEGTSVTAFRARPVSRLGDIINSNPNFVAAPNAGFGDTAYAQFRQDFLSRAPMIYVGGNDGMLHAFQASDGVEKLAYVPSKVHSRLNQLTAKTYVGSSHRYYVDGSPEISDAQVGAGNAWRTVLVGGLGAGGQGLFALDISDPTQFTEANAANIVLWEFNDTDDPDLGYVFGQPVIRKMANGKWAAIVAGGYNNSESGTGETVCSDSTTVTPAGCTTSSTGSAYLYIIYLDGPTGANNTWIAGTDYIKIRAQRGSDSAGTPNGLSQPLAADINADGVVDFVYAGDLRGRLWKFDLRSTVASDWASNNNRVVLFIARDSGGNRQPITAKPEGTLHPNGGFIITFGTGKYLENTDPSPAYLTQSFYGIWDKNDANPIGPSGGSSAQTQITDRDQLLEQTINNVTSGTNTFRVVSTNQPVWSTDTSPPEANDSPTRDMGWYMDFPNSTTTGERSVFRPILTAGRLIFTTLIPSVAACEFGGTSFLMVVDPTTGARIDGAVLDTDANGQLNTSDQISFGTGQVYASGVQSTIGITPTPTIIRTSGASAGTSGAASQLFGTTGPLVAGAGFLLAYALAAGSSGGNASTMIGLSAAGGRVSWRELMLE